MLQRSASPALSHLVVVFCSAAALQHSASPPWHRLHCSVLPLRPHFPIRLLYFILRQALQRSTSALQRSAVSPALSQLIFVCRYAAAIQRSASAAFPFDCCVSFCGGATMFCRSMALFALQRSASVLHPPYAGALCELLRIVALSVLPAFCMFVNQ